MKISGVSPYPTALSNRFVDNVRIGEFSTQHAGCGNYASENVVDPQNVSNKMALTNCSYRPEGCKSPLNQSSGCIDPTAGYAAMVFSDVAPTMPACVSLGGSWLATGHDHLAVNVSQRGNSLMWIGLGPLAAPLDAFNGSATISGHSVSGQLGVTYRYSTYKYRHYRLVATLPTSCDRIEWFRPQSHGRLEPFENWTRVQPSADSPTTSTQRSNESTTQRLAKITWERAMVAKSIRDLQQHDAALAREYVALQAQLMHASAERRIHTKTAAKRGMPLVTTRLLTDDETSTDVFRRRSAAGQCNNASMPLKCAVLPTGNACPGACETGSAFGVQGTTSHDDKREFLVSLGLTSNKGAKSRPTPYHDKVTLYSGIVGEKGTGDIWSFNPLLTQAAGSGEYNAQCIELDLNNENAHRGDADAGAGLAPPVTYGWSVTGAGKYRSTAAIAVMGRKGMWNRGIVFAANSVNQSTFQDLMSGHQKSIDIRGSPVYGVYQASSTTKNLFRGKTSHEGELHLRGPVVVERYNKKRNVVLSASASEEVASSGVVALSADGTAEISLSEEFCQERMEHSYQLTAMGRPMPNLFIATELHITGDACSFTVGGGGISEDGKGYKVSWRVHSRSVHT